MTTKHFWHSLVFSIHTQIILWLQTAWKCHPSITTAPTKHSSQNQEPHDKCSVSAVHCSLHHLSAGLCVTLNIPCFYFQGSNSCRPKTLKSWSPWDPHHSQQLPFSGTVTFLYQWHWAAQEMGLGRPKGDEDRQITTVTTFWSISLLTCGGKGKKTNTSVFLGKEM